MSLNEEIAKELQRRDRFQYDDIKRDIEEESELRAKGAKSLWVVELRQEEPVFAASKRGALALSLDDIPWGDNRNAENFKVRRMSETEANGSLGACIPWGCGLEMTCNEIRTAAAEENR